MSKGCRHRGLRIVALLEPATRHGHDARVRVGQIDLIGGTRPLDRRRRRLTPRLLAGGLGLGLPRRQLGLMLGLLARETLLSPRHDRRPRLGDLRQTLLAARQFLGDRHPVRNIRSIRRLGPGQQIGHFGLQLGLDLAGVLIGQRAVTARIGVDLRSVQPHRAHLQNAHLARQKQHLHKQTLDLAKKAPPALRQAQERRSCRDRDARSLR